VKKSTIIEIVITILLIIGLGILIYFYSNSTKSKNTDTQNNMQMPGNNSTQTSNVETKANLEVSDTKSLENEEYKSTTADESVIKTSDGGNLTLNKVTLNKSGDTSNTENCEFYGVNSALLATKNSTITVKDSTINTQAEGANAVFSTGENAVINISNAKITTTKNSSRGLDATYSGTINADTLDITTAGAHCATIATDRGEGTVNVLNSKLNTSGEGSPLVYSTGAITVKNSEGTATGSSAAVIEGKNSINIEDCNFKCYGYGRGTEGIDNTGVMIYQSMSGDAAVGSGTFTAKNSTIEILEDSSKYSTAPMFFSTNTNSIINLNNTKLLFGSNILLSATGNNGEWGTKGSNGANVTLNAENQTLTGNITADNISTIVLNLKSSKYTGTINNEKTAKEVGVTLDKESSIEITNDSYITYITDEDTTLSNIKSNGHTIYYDSSNSNNSWLNSKTITLSDGGTVKPM
jgi:hypothetical protein